MDRLALYLSLLSWTSISGVLIIALLSFGIYNFWWIVGAAVVALLLAWPSAFIVSRRIKAGDPEWNTRGNRKNAGLFPKPGAPEV